MGLSVLVGVLADLCAHAPEGAEWAAKNLAAVAALMETSGLPPHQEPKGVAVWSADAYGYGGLHHLQEIVGLVWQGKAIPKGPLDDKYPTETALFQAALPQLTPSKLRRFFKGRKTKIPFIHLVVHSDVDGYYFPIDFETPFAPLVMEQPLAHIRPVGLVRRDRDAGWRTGNSGGYEKE